MNILYIFVHFIGIISDSKSLPILKLLIHFSKLFFLMGVTISRATPWQWILTFLLNFANWTDKNHLTSLFSLFINKVEQVFICYWPFLFWSYFFLGGFWPFSYWLVKYVYRLGLLQRILLICQSLVKTLITYLQRSAGLLLFFSIRVALRCITCFFFKLKNAW